MLLPSWWPRSPGRGGVGTRSPSRTRQQPHGSSSRGRERDALYLQQRFSTAQGAGGLRLEQGLPQGPSLGLTPPCPTAPCSCHHRQPVTPDPDRGHRGAQAASLRTSCLTGCHSWTAPSVQGRCVFSNFSMSKSFP